MDGQICAGGSKLSGILQQSVEAYPDWWYACQGLGPPESELCQGRGQVSTSRPGPYKRRLGPRFKRIKAQPWPAPGERCQQGYHNQGWQEGANRNLFPDLWCPNSTRAYLSWLWEIWRRTILPPPQTLLQVSAIWPWSTHLSGNWRYLPLVFGHSQTGWLPEQGISQMPKLWRCTSCHQLRMPSIPHGEKALEIQGESRCTLPAAREQAGQTASAEVAVNSYAQVSANSQADQGPVPLKINVMTFSKSRDINVMTLVFRPTKQISWHSASNVMTLISWHWGVDIRLKVNFWWRWRKIITIHA